MKRSRAFVAAACGLLLAAVAAAKGGGGGYIVVVPGGPPPQPGDACVAEGAVGGKEAKTSDGNVVLVRGVHGINTTRCPNPAFPVLASTQKLAPEETRSTPSVQCVAQGTQAGDETTIEFYGVAKVLELLPAGSQCRTGRPASVIGAAAHRASLAAQTPSDAAPAAPREPTEEEIRREYDRLVAAAMPVREYLVRHILVRTKEDGEAAIAEIKSGTPFADVAAKSSLDPGSRSKGGDLGWASATSFIDEFSKTMVGLEPAGLSPEPTRTRFGWHVIEVVQTKVGKDSLPPYAAVKDRIAARLKNERATVASVPAKAVCRKMVAPDVPAAALRDGIKGSVVAEIRVENGKVAEVLSLSGPSVFHPAVTAALQQYECDRLDRPVLAKQSFDF